MNHRTRTAASAASLLFALLALGCATFSPRPMEEIPFMERAQTQEREGLRITVAVLDRDEAKRAFGVDLSKKQIQPVWIDIENETETATVLMLHGPRPDYFSAREAAYKSHFRLRPSPTGRWTTHFDELGIDPFVPPLGEHFRLRLQQPEARHQGGARRALRASDTWRIFDFYVPVPGFRADCHEVDWEALYAAGTAWIDLETDDELPEALKALPCCTTRKNGTGKGDPLNLVVIAQRRRGRTRFIRAGWDETETLTAASAGGPSRRSSAGSTSTPR